MSTFEFLINGSSIATVYGSYTSDFVIVGKDGIIKYIGRSWDEQDIESNFGILTSTPGQQSKVVPNTLSLEQNYPNPFNPETTIGYELRSDNQVNVQLIVYDLLGKKVKTLVNTNQISGFYTVSWDGTNDLGENVPSGFYIYSLTTPGYTETKKMLLLR